MDSGISTSSEKSTGPVINQTGTDITTLVHTGRRSTWTSSHTYGDRFIPNRGAMNMAMAQGLLTIPTKEEGVSGIVPPCREAYRKLLADTMLQGRTRILAFRNKPTTPIQPFLDDPCSTEVKPGRKIRRIPQEPEDTFALQSIISDHRINLFDWGSNNILAVGIENTVHLWNATSGSTSELVTVPYTYGPITSVSWSPDCRRIAIGLNNSHVHLYDPTTNMRIRRFQGIHKYLVGSLAWNNYVLTTGSSEGTITNNDVRIRSHVVNTYHGHTDEVCGLKWTSSGNHLASGGNDNLLHIWDVSKSSPLHRFNNHTAMVRALAWCPFQSNLLASGGGASDHCIKLWNVSTGTCSKSVNTGSQVCSLLWNNNERELLSSHGYVKNQLALWRYPSMVQMAEITGHIAPVLYLAQGPDECTVASVSQDETMKLWHIFEKPTKNCTSRTSQVEGPCNMYSHIR